jgi:hypothetical protein
MDQVTLQSICKRCGSVDVIQGIGHELRNSAFMVFVGISGCGVEMAFQSHAPCPQLTPAGAAWVLRFGADERLAA